MSERRRIVFTLLGALVWVCVAAARGGYFSAWLGPSKQAAEERLVAAAEIEVLDGDTFRVGGDEVRLLGADTPEKAAPWFRGDQEPWGSRASDFVRRRLDAATRIELRGRGARDVYGRSLAHVIVDGEPLSALLVEAALAYPTAHRFGDGGFPQLSAEIQRRARLPVFPPPWSWRRAHRTSP